VQLFDEFAEKIRRIPNTPTKRDLLINDFLLEKEGSVEIFYSPHNQYVNQNARVLIIGITPGWTQMARAMSLAKNYLEEDMPYDLLLKRVNREVRFYGSMRTYLVGMLDDLQLSKYLGLSSAEELFNSCMLHTTSLIKFPVFVNSQNYNGHNPVLYKSPLLMKYARDTLKTVILSQNRPFIIPLGKSVDHILNMYVKEGRLAKEQCLFDFPHPSGANGHRQKQFEIHKNDFKEKIRNFFT
jgi:hypothetical protein